MDISSGKKNSDECMSTNDSSRLHEQTHEQTRHNSSQTQRHRRRTSKGEGGGGGKRESSDRDQGNKFSKGLYIVTFNCF
jgi:hypothetical protein